MFEMFYNLGNWTFSVVDQSGYWGVFLLSFLDRVTIFLIPAEFILPVFGALTAQGRFSFIWLFVLVTVGSFWGNLFLYWVSIKGGRPFIEKYGKYFLISKHDLEHSDRLFAKYGDRVILIGYLLPTSIRSLVPIPAGIYNMNFRKFVLYTIFASLPYNLILIFAGIKARENWDILLSYFEKFNLAVTGLVMFVIIWYIYRHFNDRHLTHE